MRRDHNRRHGRRRRRTRTLYLRATAVVFNQDDDLLLVKHNGERAWALPGGRVEDEEDPDERVVIEVEEETGVNIGDPLMHVGRYAGTVAVHEVYLAPGSGEPRPDHREIQDTIWWDRVSPLQVQPHVDAILNMIDNIEIPDSDMHVAVQDSSPPMEEVDDNPVQTQSFPIAEPQAEMQARPPEVILDDRAPISHTERPPTWVSVMETVWTWTVIVVLLMADWLIWVMLITRSGERRIRPTKRVSWRKGLKQELMKRQDNTCVYCGYRRIARSLDIDHIIPAVRGGSNDPSNLQVICRPCNQRKGDQTDEEFRARYSRLVPAARLTPPNRRITQNEFKEETRRTSAAASAREFRKTRYISPREKILSGCFITGGVVAAAVLLGLSSIGAEGLLLLLPALILGGAVGFGIWLRAYMTGATSEME